MTAAVNLPPGMPKLGAFDIDKLEKVINRQTANPNNRLVLIRGGDNIKIISRSKRIWERVFGTVILEEAVVTYMMMYFLPTRGKQFTEKHKALLIKMTGEGSIFAGTRVATAIEKIYRDLFPYKQ
jgi:hypothetical protein